MKSLVMLFFLLFTSLNSFSQSSEKNTSNSKREKQTNEKSIEYNSQTVTDKTVRERKDYPNDVKIGVSVFYVENDKPVEYSEWKNKQKR